MDVKSDIAFSRTMTYEHSYESYPMGRKFGHYTIHNNLVSSLMDGHMQAWSRPPLARQAIAMSACALSGQGVLEITRARVLYISAFLAKSKFYSCGFEPDTTRTSDRVDSAGLRNPLNI
jgi:hypothetical protein